MQEPLAIGPSGGMPMPSNMQTLHYMPQIQAYAAIMKKAGFFNGSKIVDTDPKAAEKRKVAEEQAEAKMIYIIAIGVDMGLTPAECIQGLYVNRNGKIEPTNALLKEKLESHPVYGYETEMISDQACSVTFLKNGKKIEKPGNPVIWTSQRVEKAKLDGQVVYQGFPRNWLFAACIRDGVKFFCPGLFKGQNFEIDINFEEAQSTEHIVRGQAKEEVEAECRDALQAALDAEGSTIEVNTVTIIETGEVIQKPNNDAVILKEAEIYRERGDEEKAQAKEEAVKITASQKTELTLAGTKNGWHPADISAYVRQAFGVASSDLTLSQWAVAKAHVSLTPPPPPEGFGRAPATK